MTLEVRKIIIILVILLDFSNKIKSDEILNECDESEKNFINTESQEEKYYGFGGTLFNTSIIADNTDIRAYPALASEIIAKSDRNDKVKVIGISKAFNFIYR
jgi:hypothetical protein